jgi:catechol 2,3-dioxygenase-like lactoylglutathione lyase family enzyme
MDPMTTPRPGIALFLTEIMVTDWHKSVRWYVETLGLRLVLEDAPHQYALLDAPPRPGRVALKGGAPTGLPRDLVRLVFEVADLDAEHDRLARLDTVVSAPEESPEGYRAIRLRDPEGTPITLFSWKTSEGLASSGA